MFANPKTYAAQLRAAFPAGTLPSDMVFQAADAYPQAPSTFWDAVLDELRKPAVPTPAQMAIAVYEHASRHYEKGGWDFIVECWTEAEIAVEVRSCRTYEGAIAKMGRIAKAQDERRQEVRAEMDCPEGYPPEG